MRRLVVLIPLLGGWTLHAQMNPAITYVAGPQSGPCEQPIGARLSVSNGLIYTCQNGQWAVIGGSEGGNLVSSVFTRTGDIAAQSGDYGVSQVTGAAPTASPTFTGTVQADTIVANDFVGYLNGIAIGGTPVAGNVLLATDSTHAVWGNNVPTGSGFYHVTDGSRDAAAHAIMPQDLPATISSDTTGNANTASAFNHTPTSCAPVAGVTTYPTGIDSQGNGTGCSSPTGSGQPGSVTTITVDDIPGIADTTVANASTTPHVSFTLLGAPAHSFWGNNTDTEDGAVGYSNITVADLPEEIAGTQAHNTVWAAPDGTNGFPSFRALLPSDINGLPATNPIMSGGTTYGFLSYLTSTGNLTLTSNSNLDFSTAGGVREMELDSSGNFNYGVNLGRFMDTNRNIFPAAGTFTGNVSAPLFVGALQGTATGITGNQTANAIYAGPAVGNASPATFRALVATDLPANITSNTTGSAGTITGSINESQVTGLAADLALKAPLASPALTGIPTAPTAAASTNTTQVATTAMVQAAIVAAVPVNEIFGQITIAAGASEGNDSSHAGISISSVCVASPMNVISGAPNTNPWEFVINVSPSNIAIIAQNTMAQKQVYSYMCKP